MGRIQWITVSVATLGALCVPADALVPRLLVAAGTGGIVWAVQGWTRRRITADVAELTTSARSLAGGETEQIVLPSALSELAPLAHALEDVRSQVRMRMRMLEQQREDLASHLTRTEERLRDPNAEARRLRIARIQDLRAELTFGGRPPTPVAMLDLSLESAVLGMRPEDGDCLVPGLPVHLSLQMGGISATLNDLVVLAPARGGLLDLKEWVFQFQPALHPQMLPPPLAAALELRGAARIRPVATNPAGATLVCSLGPLRADVVDVSRTGLGVTVGLDGRRVGRIGTHFTIQLHLPAMGEVVVLPVTLRNMAVRTDGVRLGLSFDATADATELGKVEAWLGMTRRMLAA